MEELPLISQSRLDRINAMLRSKQVARVEKWFNGKYGWILTNGNRSEKNRQPKLYTSEPEETC